MPRVGIPWETRVPEVKPFTPCMSTCDPDFPFTNTLRPTLAATGEDLGGGTVTYDWEVAARASTTVATGTSSGASGALSTWQVPAGVLVDDTQYLYRVRASDTIGSSDWSEWSALNTDLDAGSLSQAQSEGATERVAALLEAQNDVLASGQAAVTNPDAGVMEVLGPRTPAVDVALDRALEIRETVTDANLSIASTEFTIISSYTQNVPDGIAVTALYETAQTYVDNGNNETVSSGWTTLARATFPPQNNSGGSTAARTSTTSAAPGMSEMDTFAVGSEISVESVNDQVDPEWEANTPPGSAPTDQAPTTSPIRPRIASGVQSYLPHRFAHYGSQFTQPTYANVPQGNTFYKNMGSNCANFASQALHFAGWKVHGNRDRKDPAVWTYNIKGLAGPSYTWAAALNLYRYAYNHRRLRAFSNAWDARQGDLLFVDWKNDKDSMIDHVALVTARSSNGTPYISQKTDNRHNILLSTWQNIARNDKYVKGVQMYYPLSYMTR